MLIQRIRKARAFAAIDHLYLEHESRLSVTAAFKTSYDIVTIALFPH